MPSPPGRKPQGTDRSFAGILQAGRAEEGSAWVLGTALPSPSTARRDPGANLRALPPKILTQTPKTPRAAPAAPSMEAALPFHSD